jgi:hypothetical protein
VSEISAGWYKVAGNAIDTNTLGPLLLHAVDGSNVADKEYEIVAFDPQSASAMITGINSLAPPTNWNLDSIDGSGRRDLGKWLGVAPNALKNGNVPVVHSNAHQTWRVRVGDGNDSTGNGSDSTPYATFRKPTLVGASYDEVELGPGLYPVTTGCTFPQFFAVRGRGRAMTQVMIDNTGTPIHVRNALFEHLTIRFTRYTFAVTVTGGSSGTITYTVSVGNQSDTVTVAYNASTATLQSAIEGLGFIGTGNAPVTGSPGAYTVTFARLLGAYLQPDEVRLSAAGSGGFGGTVTAYLTPTTFLLGAVNGDEPVRLEFNDAELIGESDVLEVPAYSDLSFTDCTIRTRVDMLHGGPLKRLTLTRSSLINYGNTQSDPGNFTLSATGILSTTADESHVTDTLIDVRDGIAGTYAVSVGAGQKFTMEGGRIHTQTVYGTPEYALVVDANAGPVLLIDVDIDRSKVSDPGNKVQYLTRAQAMDWRAPIQATEATTIDNVTINSNVTKINGTSIAGTGTRVADAFVSMLNVASPAFTLASVNQTGDGYAIVSSGTFGLSAINTKLGTPAGASVSVDIAAVKTDSGNLISRLGAITGTGVNTVLGFFKALLSKVASAPSDIGGTFDPATDSAEAIVDVGVNVKKVGGQTATATGAVDFDDLGSGGGGGSLSGPSSVTLTFHDSGGSAVPLVDFTVVGQGSSRANGSGVAAFGLSDGTYTVVARPTSGTLFANYSLTVSGTTAATITGTGITITGASDPATTNAYLTTYDAHGAKASGVTVTFKLLTPPGTAGQAHTGDTFSATSSGTSLNNLQVVLLRGAIYQAWRGTDEARGRKKVFTTDDETTFQLPEILGFDT